MIVLNAKNGREKSVIDVPKGENAVVFEENVAPETQVVLPENASLTHWRLVTKDAVLNVRLPQNASYTLITVKLGAGRCVVEASLDGKACVFKSNLAYVAKNDDVCDIRTNVRHNADKTVSSQLIKGAVYDAAKASFEGGVFIPCGKKAVDGSQQHRALLLSDNAEISAVPKLEIYSDDVKCAHGSAVGSLDETQMYYLMTRGLDENGARALLTEGFLNEILFEISDASVRDAVLRAVARFAGFAHDV